MNWFKTILRALGLLAAVAADVAPVLGAGKGTQDDLAKAKAAGEALGRIADKVDEVVK